MVDIHIFNRLVALDETFNIKGDLAEYWEVFDDGKTHVFHLHKNVKWHDGQPFTSADVKWHFENVAAGVPKTSPATGLFKNLESIEAPDDYTVVFRHKTPTILDIYTNIPADTCILPKHIYEGKEWETNPANSAPIGTGPFKVTEYIPDQHTIMEANEDYFKGRPYLDKLIWQIIPQQETAILALEAGDIGAIGEPWPRGPSIPVVRENPDLGYGAIPGSRIVRLRFNMNPEAWDKWPWLADVNVRKAMIHAIDPASIIEDMYYGVAADETRNPISLAFGDYYNWDTHENYPVYDTAKAEKLLDDAGYPRGSDGWRFEITKYLCRSDAVDIAEVVKQYLEEVGIKVTLFPMEYATALSTVNRSPEGMGTEYPVYQDYGGVGSDLAALPSEFYSDRTTSWANCNFYSSEKVDAIIDDLQSTVDKAERVRLAMEFQEEILKDFPQATLFNLMRSWAYHKDYGNFENHPKPLYAVDPFGYYVWWTGGREAETVITTTETVTETVTVGLGMEYTIAIAAIAAVVGVVIGYMVRGQRG
jgi:peptide/nickel transport system substrate-binding protein